MQRSIFRSCIAVFLCFVLVMLHMPQAMAQRGGGLSIVRDDEIEHYLRTWSNPIFDAAGLDSAAITIYLVNEPSLNAFVAGGQNMFYHTGLLVESEDPGELIGVIAHETGHISGGHISRTGDAMADAGTAAIVATILGAAAALATGDPRAGVAAIGAGQTVAQRNFLSYSRGQEASADQAAATFLERTGKSPEGMLSFMEKLSGEEYLPVSRQVEYVRTHPLTSDRVEFFREVVETSPHTGKEFPAHYYEMMARMHAKLHGFLEPDYALREYSADDSATHARYARAIAKYRKGRMDEAVPLVNELIKREPGNPWFHELKGQMLFENSRIGEAIPAYREAARLRPKSPLILLGLGHALVEGNEPALLREAITVLQRATTLENRSAHAHRLLATAFGKLDRQGEARLHLAEESLLRRDNDNAEAQARRALELLETESTEWYRARDILAFAEVQRSRED